MKERRIRERMMRRKVMKKREKEEMLTNGKNRGKEKTREEMGVTAERQRLDTRRRKNGDKKLYKSG